MIEIKNKELCSGCGACANSCPVDAIYLCEDEEGFIYPKIHTDKCIHCNRCERVCPILNHDILADNISLKCIYKKAYAVKNTDEKIRSMSSSGGVFFALAKSVIELGGVVVGATFDDDFQVYHKIAYSIDEVYPLIGSKYAQSRMENIMCEVKQILEKGRIVLFTGLSCQIEGLCSYLGKEYENLYCVDLICMGIPSSGVWKKYLNTYFKDSRIQSINFKDKSKGWHRFSVKIDFADGDKFLQTGADNYFMQAMFKGYTLRPSCFACKFKSETKRADLTIADCWGCESYLPEVDDNKGTSMTIVHSDKGMKLIDLLERDCFIKEFDYENVLTGNPNYHNCVKTGKNRGLFYFLLDKISPRVAFEILCRNPQKSLWEKFVRKFRRA